MSSNFLESDEIELLVDLLRRSQRARVREALCRKIGIKTDNLHFLKDGSDQDFLIQLITYLHDIDNQEAICNICCKELLPVFSKSREADKLKQIISKINCCNYEPPSKQDLPKREETSQLHPTEKLPKIILVSTVTIISSLLIVIIKFTGQSSEQPPIPNAIPNPNNSTSQGSTYQLTCQNISINGDELSAECSKKDGSLNQTTLKLEGIENLDGNLQY